MFLFEVELGEGKATNPVVFWFVYGN